MADLKCEIAEPGELMLPTPPPTSAVAPSQSINEFMLLQDQNQVSEPLVAGTIDEFHPGFCEEGPGYDTILRSSDNRFFRVRRRDLEAYSGQFARGKYLNEPRTATRHGSAVQLSENEETLALLLKFLRLGRQPRVSQVKHEALFQLAEAAEKYEVYSALQICYIFMKSLIPKHPLRLLKYGAVHNYPDIITDAAPRTVEMSFFEVQTMMESDTLLRWVAYREHWKESRVDQIMEKLKTPPVFNHCLHPGGKPECEYWWPFANSVIKQLEPHPSLADHLQGIFSRSLEMTDPCGKCRDRGKGWWTRCESILSTVQLPRF